MNVRKLLSISVFCGLLGPYVSASEQGLDENGIATGFEVVNKKYVGKGQTIVVIDEGLSFAPQHPALKGKAIERIEVGRQPNPSPEFQDESKCRYIEGFKPELDFLNDGYHGQKIVSVLLANPVSGQKVTVGIVPDAKVKLVSYSDVVFGIWKGGHMTDWPQSPVRYASSAVYTFRQAAQIIPQSRLKELQQTLATYTQNKIDLLGQKIDDSIYDAFHQAFKSDGRVISVSCPLVAACDFKNAYKMAPEFLAFLASGLKKYDKILVFAAGNQKQDLTQNLAEGLKAWPNAPKIGSDYWKNKEWYEFDNYYQPIVTKLQWIYFQQFSQIPDIKARTLLAVNVESVVKVETELFMQSMGFQSFIKQEFKQYIIHPEGQPDTIHFDFAGFASNVFFEPLVNQAGIENLKSKVIAMIEWAYFPQGQGMEVSQKACQVSALMDEVYGFSNKAPQPKFTFSNGKSYNLQLAPSSNYPGANKALQEMTVAALGGHTVADREDEFKLESGTSLSAPRIAGLLALMDEHYQAQGQKLTSPELVHRLKKNCICPQGFENVFGNGVIDPAAMLKNSTH